MTKSARMEPGVKLRDADKMALIPVKVLPTEPAEMLRKPEWLKIKLPRALSALMKSKALCASMVCIQCVKKHPALTLLNVLTTVRPPL